MPSVIQKKILAINATTIVVFSLLLCAIAPQKSESYTLNDAITSALAHNAGLKAAQKRLETAKLEKREAYAGFLPRVTSQISSTQLGNDAEAYSKSTAAAQWIPINTPDYHSRSTAVDWELFAFGKTTAIVKSRIEILRAAEADFETQRNILVLNTIQSYEQVIIAHRMYDFAIENENTLLNLREKAAAGVELGENTNTNLAFIDAELARAISSKETAATSIQNAEASLTYYTGEVPTSSLEPINIKALILPQTKQDFLSEAKIANTEIQVAQRKVTAATYEKSAAAAAFLPSITFEARHSVGNNPNSLRGTTYAASLYIPIFNRGLDMLSIKKTTNKLRESQHVLDDVNARALAIFINAWNQHIIRKSLNDSTTKELYYRQTVVDSLEEEFNAGTKSAFELLRARSDLLMTQSRSLEVEAETIKATFTILKENNTLKNLDFASMTLKNKLNTSTTKTKNIIREKSEKTMEKAHIHSTSN